MSHSLKRATRETPLGRDFWLFQFGQLISTIGDACGNIALTWWILDVTRSAGQVSSVLAIAMLVQTTLTPVLGPLGDRFSRRRLILAADLIRGSMIGVLALVTLSGNFSLPLVLAVYLPFVVGSALFNSNNMSIVPQLVPPSSLQRAVRMSESLQAVGRVLGGIVAGALVSWVGVGSAFFVDAVSFGIAALATARILASERQATEVGGLGKTPAKGIGPFVAQLRDGFQVIYRVPILFWLCVAVGFFNLVLNPLQVLLPTYAKLGRGLPAWFLGGLESSIGAGIIVGATCVGALERRSLAVSSVTVGLVSIGGAIALLPNVPGVILPLLMMFALGVGAAWTNIPISTRVAVAVPDHFRSRVNSIVAFITDGTAPFGIAAAGGLVGTLGVTGSLTCLGVLVLLAVPLLFLIRGFVEFFRRSPAELDGYFMTSNPEVFGRSVHATPPGTRGQPI